MPDRGCVVLLGDFSEERLDLTDVVRDFCWSVVQSADLSGLREIGARQIIPAAISHPLPRLKPLGRTFNGL